MIPFARSKKKNIQHRYVRRIYQNLEGYIFWGIRMEVLFRGFSHKEMFQIEAEIRELVSRFKSRARESGQLKEIVLENFVTKPFKDEVI